ncbi:NAD-dependent DNA ligase LigA [bacterium endosymbiont of Pedicinus badii]|uniref:NAD-dependent DNA ligase LigA n=1 Tax=bacterium endosymbiont of Pedicinus badii TaxID=1719126 RepID=UPI0009BB956D|nr:NAD-dependent DNA ligase LigA [bacterium endosymbiont of Pedicinus badii]OQM34471.1 hypothetical protein AOQ89_01110 [bacterium endosymbiont of Pedicinus badii]
MEKKIKKLQKKILKWNFFYYIKNSPKVTDYEYDVYFDILKKMESNTKVSNPITQNIWFQKEKNFLKSMHIEPMLSLESIFKISDLKKFEKKIQKKIKNKKIQYCCELKIDGIAVNLRYKKNSLLSAATRGNGKIGENVTKKIYHLDTIPKILSLEKENDIYEIRGEIFVSKKNFLKINSILKKKNKKIFSNARSAASGILRSSSNNDLVKYLDFFCYGIGFLKNKEKFISQFKILKFLKKIGFPTEEKNTKIFYQIKEIENFYHILQKKRKKLDYDTDGIVVKINSFRLQKKLGNTHRFPKWSIAVKFQGEEKISKILSVYFTVGKTGSIVPIAKIAPIYISGTKITNVNLYNFKFIKKMNLMINDRIIVEKIGNTIPKITKKISSFYKKESKFCIEIPKNCPSCKEKIFIKKNGLLSCKNKKNCLQQKICIFQHFVSRNAMNISGIGKKIIEDLIVKNIVIEFSDIFKLSVHDLLKIEKIKEKKAKKIFLAIQNSKRVNFSCFLYSLSIKGLGKSNSVRIAKTLKNTKNFLNVEYNTLKKIKNLGKKNAKNIFLFLKQNRESLKNLINSISIVV